MTVTEIFAASLSDLVSYLMVNGWTVAESTSLEQAQEMAKFQAFLDGSI